MNEDILVLTFEGAQTIEKAEAVKDTLLSAIKGKKKEILINLSKVSKVDLSFFQLLYAADLELGKSKKTLSLTGEVPEEIIKAIKLSGYDKNIDSAGGTLFRQMIGKRSV